jgi:putative endonuclease
MLSHSTQPCRLGLARGYSQYHMDKQSLGSKKSSVPSERSESRESTYIVYLLRTSANTLYIGQTNNLEKRLKEHQNKTSKSAKYIRYFSSFELVYSEKYPTRKEAIQREWQLKNWSRAKKEALIRGAIVLSKTEGIK